MTQNPSAPASGSMSPLQIGLIAGIGALAAASVFLFILLQSANSQRDDAEASATVVAFAAATSDANAASAQSAQATAEAGATSAALAEATAISARATAESDDYPIVERLVTFEVIITTTPDLLALATNEAELNAQATRAASAEMAATRVAEELASLRDTLATATAQAGSATEALNATQRAENLQEVVASLPPNCIAHVLAEGENLPIVAEIYGVNVLDILAVNDLDEDSARSLQIGDVLIVPLESCGLLESDETIATPGRTAGLTVTLAPTATSAQVEIVDVIAAGDLTLEAVEILNTGNTVDIGGWSLSDGQSNTFVFPDERRLFSNASVTINTRTGQNTPIALYWGRDTAVFEPGDVVILSDADGVVQASIRIPAE